MERPTRSAASRPVSSQTFWLTRSIRPALVDLGDAHADMIVG
jgi:hypothetical protein